MGKFSTGVVGFFDGVDCFLPLTGAEFVYFLGEFERSLCPDLFSVAAEYSVRF